MARIAEGSVSDFERLYDAHARLVYGIAVSQLGHGRDADDVVLDVFLAAWRRAGDFRPQIASVTSWLTTIAIRRCFDVHRRRAHQRNPGLLAEVEHREQAALISAAIAALPAVQRRPVALALLGGYTDSQIAQMTQTPLEAVKSRLRLGTARVRAHMG